MKKSLLIATLGYPGSGKTYFSERFCKQFNFVHVNSDKIRFEMFSNPNFSQEETTRLFKFIDWLVEEFLQKNINVIVDANSPLRAHRNDFAKIAKKYKVDFAVLHIQTPLDLAEKRILKRRNITSPKKKKYYRPIEISVIHTIKNMTEKPHSKEPLIQIDGTSPYSQQLREFKSRLKYKL